jgi:hypothetical protein
MTLIEAVRQIEDFDDELTIYARQPWTHAAEVRLAVEDSEEERQARKEGFQYFLEVFVAREFLEDWIPTQRRVPTDTQTCERLIAYAINDA